jgi:hypothetical protein
VEAFHELRDEVGLASEVQDLGRRQPSGFKHSGVRDRLSPILSSVGDDEVDGCVDLRVGNVPTIRHSEILSPGISPAWIIGRSRRTFTPVWIMLSYSLTPQ